MQEFWLPNDTYEPVYPLETRKKVDHNATTIAELRKQQARYDRDLSDYVRGVNQRLGKDVVLIVPVGQAAASRCARRSSPAQAPGLKTQVGSVPRHLGPSPTAAASAGGLLPFCGDLSPQPGGLAAAFRPGKAASPTEKDKLNRLLQELAWDAVLHHPLSGVKPSSRTE